MIKIKETIFKLFSTFNNTNKLSDEYLDTFIFEVLKEITRNDKDFHKYFNDEDFHKYFEKINEEYKQILKSSIVDFFKSKTSGMKKCHINKIIKRSIDEYNIIKENLLLEKYNYHFDDKLNFYYDETNNARRFWIKNSRFNHAVNKNFVLGGVVFNENVYIDNIDDLINNLELQKTVCEIKSKLIFKSSPTFEKSLDNEKLNKILNWIDENNLYIHFINIDHINVIINDIFNILHATEEEKLLYEDILYKSISKNIDKISEILIKNNYPKIKKENILYFCNDWKEFLIQFKYNNSTSRNEFEKIKDKVFFDGLIDLFDIDKNTKDFLYSGKKKYIIENYSKYYTIKPDIFKNSTHIYDTEETINKIINPHSKDVCGKNNNIKFENSRKVKLIQISDIIVSLLSKFFIYIEEENSTELKNCEFIHKLYNSIFKFNDIQKKNFLLLISLLKKSYDKNKLFFYSENTLVQNNNFDLILKINDIKDLNIYFKSTNN